MTRPEHEHEPVAVCETDAAAARRFAGILNRLDEALRERGIQHEPGIPIDDAPVVTAIQTIDQLRYERRLLGAARMVLDLVAVGDESRWPQARRQAEDLAQRIVDEIGHPVTDEPALGPSLRDLLYQAWGVIANVGGRAGGGWDGQGKEWMTAAARWRDRYHETLSDTMAKTPSVASHATFALLRDVHADLEELTVHDLTVEQEIRAKALEAATYAYDGSSEDILLNAAKRFAHYITTGDTQPPTVDEP